MAGRLGRYYEGTDRGTLKQHIVLKKTNHINLGSTTEIVKRNTFSEVNKQINVQTGIRRWGSIEEKQVTWIDRFSVGGE